MPIEELVLEIVEKLHSYPDKHIGLLCVNFRRVRRVFDKIAELAVSKVQNVRRMGDAYTLELDGAKLTAVPMNEGLCGWRFDMIYVISFDLINEVVRPMLATQGEHPIPTEDRLHEVILQS